MSQRYEIAADYLEQGGFLVEAQRLRSLGDSDVVVTIQSGDSPFGRYIRLDAIRQVDYRESGCSMVDDKGKEYGIYRADARRILALLGCNVPPLNDEAVS